MNFPALLFVTLYPGRMCFYNQHHFSCGDYKWGSFREHCSREYRIGETCGTKLVYATYDVDSKCRHCIKIDSKTRRYNAERDRIVRWSLEGCRYAASLERAKENVKSLEEEIRRIGEYRRERASRYGALGIGEDGDAKDRTQSPPRQHAGWAFPIADLKSVFGAAQDAIPSHSSTLVRSSYSTHIVCRF